MPLQRHQLLTAGKPQQWKIDLREAGVSLSLTAAEAGNQVIFEFYPSTHQDGSPAQLEADDERKPGFVARWRLLYPEAEEFAHHLRTTVREDVYDRRRTMVNFVFTRDHSWVLMLNRTDIDQLNRAMNEVLTLSKPK